MKPMVITDLAIVQNIKTNYGATAIVDVWTYDVLGNAKDGYEVNDRCRIHTAIKVRALLSLLNVPRRPGAKDRFRSFPAESSFPGVAHYCWEIPNLTLRRLLGLFKGPAIEIEGDGENYQVSRKSDGKPLGEVVITGWSDDKAEAWAIGNSPPSKAPARAVKQ